MVPPTTQVVKTLRPRQNGRHFPDDIFKGIFLNENEWISLKISLKFVPKVRINNIPALVQIMAWRRPGDKPLSGPVMISLLTHLCVARPPWVNGCTRLTGPNLTLVTDYRFVSVQRHDCRNNLAPTAFGQRGFNGLIVDPFCLNGWWWCL